MDYISIYKRRKEPVGSINCSYNFENKTSNTNKRTFNFIIKSLGITIQIIRNPISSDLDGSKRIDWKEAFYLGFALSLDSIGIGIGSSIVGFNSFLFPILVASFQLIFLSLGTCLGRKIISYVHLPKNIWSIISGALLIFIGIIRLFAN